MSLNRMLWVALLSYAAVPSARAQDRGRRIELEESLQSRYRITVVGGGIMGARGENAIRHAGGIVALVRDGLFGAYDRSKLSSNAIQDGKSDLVTGNKDVRLAAGQKFYVTAAYVGSDVVTLGLLGVQTISHDGKTSRVWSTANFFFPSDTLAQGDIGKVYSVLDQWLLPEGAGLPEPSSVPHSPSAPIPVAAPGPAPVSASATLDLKPGMTHDEIVRALGQPLLDVTFNDRQWMTFPAMTITLEQGKLTSVDFNAQASTPVKVHSDPDGADVFVDGSFVSSTPAVLRLRPGTYKIAVKMSGYTDWEREVKILPGAQVNLNAKLSR
jgi:PEGA domain